MIEKHTKVPISISSYLESTWVKIQGIFDIAKDRLGAVGLERIVYTESLKRLALLVYKCLENQEPVLLVGETGCGKTTIC